MPNLTPPADPALPSGHEAFQLFILGFLTLFLELVLIRYLAGNIWNLGYFPNLVLMAAFIGMGIGYIFHHNVSAGTSRTLFVGGAICLFCLVLVVRFCHPALPGMQIWQSTVGGELLFSGTPHVHTGDSSPIFAIWFGGVLVTFALVTQRTAKLFARFPPLRAYTLDIVGSCLGIVTFMLCSWMQLPAFVWFLILIPAFTLAMDSNPKGRRLVVAVVLVAIAMVVRQQDTLLLGSFRFQGQFETTWSPYQKVEYRSSPQNPDEISVNGIDHQRMLTAAELKTSIYQRPLQIHGNVPGARLRNVLVIGAGSGNDVSAALVAGAERVEAVEIDPVIARLGKEHHPCHPYDDPRVILTIDDARAYMARSRQKYDLIVFALTDSLVKVSAMSQLRLENYLFTVESAKRAYQLLTETGTICFYNYYRRPWVVRKIEAMVYRGTGRYPVTQLNIDRDFAVVGVGPQLSQPVPADAMVDSDAVPTDNWPFLYVEQRKIPEMYWTAMKCGVSLVAVLLLILQLTDRRAGRGQRGAFSAKAGFALMGTAFLVLETKSVIQFSLLFGTTWINSSLVFLAVLISVLAANFLASRFTCTTRLLCGTCFLLILSCLVPLVYPLANLLMVESTGLRFVLASALTFSPIFIANFIFGLMFARQTAPEHVFGWNLLGATLGGIAEYISIQTGYNALSWFIAGCYALAFLFLLYFQMGSQKAADAPAPSLP